MENNPSKWQCVLANLGVLLMGLIAGMILAKETGLRVEMQPLIIPAICFGLGFLFDRLSKNGSLDEMTEDIEDLGALLGKTGNSRSRTIEYGGQESYPILDEPFLQRGEPAVLAKKRKVRVTKLSEANPENGGKTRVIGLEESLPEVGKNYIVVNEQGKVFCSSPVSKISSRYILTKNSLYEIEPIDEEYEDMNYRYQKRKLTH